MEADRLETIERIFESALTRPRAERTRFVRDACADDTSLLQEVRSLLDSHESAEAFLKEPALGDSFSLATEAMDIEVLEPGTAIGPYEIESFIAAGGMGAVYRAHRAALPDAVPIAIKVIRASHAGPGFLARFRAEQRALATLDHPNIARLIDAGSSDGQPYLAMEYIDGKQLTSWCDAMRLDTRERLKMFLQICDAVQYAHQRLIVHRDIKPRNILVTHDGVPKLLDFGIAKVLDPDQPTPDVTRTTSRLLTPEYASPEQIRGEPTTTSTDVYSLAVVLYELLTGRRPYRIGTRSAAEIERVICNQEPTRPSTAVIEDPTDTDDAHVSPEDLSRVREGTPQRLRGRLSGDIDHILLKALRKEPESRYASVALFADDVRHHLDGRPIAARTGVLAYRTAKFIRRNRTPVAVAGVMLLLILIGVSASVILADRASTAARRSRTHAANTNEMLRSVLDVIHDFDRTQSGRARMMAKTILERNADRFIDELDNEPIARVQLMQTLADAYSRLGFFDDALQWRRSALDELRDQDAEPLTIATAEYELARVLYSLRKYEQALGVFERVVDVRKRLLGSDNFDTLEAEYQLVLVRFGGGEPHDAVQPTFARIAGIALAHQPPTSQTVGWIYRYSVFLDNKGDYAGAEAYLRDATVMAEHVEPPDPLLRAVTLASLAVTLTNQTEFEEAESLRRASLTILEELFRQDHPAIAEAKLQLGLLLKDMGRYGEAESLVLESIEITTSVEGENSTPAAHALHALAKVYTDAGNLERALDVCARALEAHEVTFGPTHRNTARPMTHLARIHTRLGQYDVAEPLLRRALEIRLRTKPPGHWKTAKTRSVLGHCLAGLGEFEEAQELLDLSFADIERDRGPSHRRTREAIHRHIFLYRQWGREADRADWEAKLDAAGGPAY